MYSTCLFCHAPLGTNEAVEFFPVGRRLAFDAAKGRLWAVCRKCERWNLTPIEERWEAIEECERSFRETRLRVATEQIGLARLREGLELVRIGKPLRPEFAAWRYGDQFGRRRRKHVIMGGAVVVAGLAIPALGPAIGVSLGGMGAMIPQMTSLGIGLYRRNRVVARVQDNEGNLHYVRTIDVENTMLLPPIGDKAWGLRVNHRPDSDPQRRWWKYGPDKERTDIHGEDAVRVVAQLLPSLNRAGASGREVQEAVTIATRHDDPSVVFERAARLAANRRSWNEFGKQGMLTVLPKEMRLALEMASHEESERRALEGELSLLEDAWREAEEIASISDDMFVPTEVSQKLAEIKDRVR